MKILKLIYLVEN
ncbi:hypothetical protein CJF30_00011016 [Rutstroemia sp. NJR-2017a BBW]|nr:hypothetical protein CJF30_00003013 [Rutstroemia sp. NJR-2017a BBW]PQE28286.1 hypothetical protein CJF30_00011016 [Rutstroemia sp. NJR-2017a BBW]